MKKYWKVECGVAEWGEPIVDYEKTLEQRKSFGSQILAEVAAIELLMILYELL